MEILTPLQWKFNTFKHPRPKEEQDQEDVLQYNGDELNKLQPEISDFLKNADLQFLEGDWYADGCNVYAKITGENVNGDRVQFKDPVLIVSCEILGELTKNGEARAKAIAMLPRLLKLAARLVDHHGDFGYDGDDQIYYEDFDDEARYAGRIFKKAMF